MYCDMGVDRTMSRETLVQELIEAIDLMNDLQMQLDDATRAVEDAEGELEAFEEYEREQESADE